MAAPGWAQSVEFTDVSDDYWARPFIERLADAEIIAGFPNGSFKPNQPVTRAQFAAIVRNAFEQPQIRSATRFSDVSADYWARDAIAEAYRRGFLSGYPNGTFRPEQQIPRVQVLVSLVNGLEFSASGSINEALSLYRDADQIPSYAEDEVAAATESALVVNYPNIDTLRPEQVSTRADVAAFIYQALVAAGRMPALQAGLQASNYIVGYSGAIPTVSGVVRAGTSIELHYPNGDDVDLVVAPGQTVTTTLEVARPLRNQQGQIVIPAGSPVQGRIVPVEIRGASVTAAKFVADSLSVNNRRYSIDAESDAIAATTSVEASTLQGALVTAAAESILASLTGNRNLGSLVEAILTGDSQTTSQSAVIVIDPTQLDLTVESDFTVGN
ncbi:S-layer homology domain-containing protein [Halomicronema hongdechloris]|nr:S-layer homology domain-containing protein [Halomicronema hongdechloris]